MKLESMTEAILYELRRYGVRRYAMVRFRA